MIITYVHFRYGTENDASESTSDVGLGTMLRLQNCLGTGYLAQYSMALAKKKRKRHLRSVPKRDLRCGSPMRVEAGEDESSDLSEDCFGALHEAWVRNTKENMEQLHERAGDWRKGRWSVEEIRTLKRNVRAFTKEHNIKDLGAFIFDNSRGKHQKMYRYIAKDIKRPLINVYRKMIRVFDVSHYVGKWTDDQEKELLRLHGLHGNQWGTIGRAMGMSGPCVHDKFRMLKRKRKGAWSLEEEGRLVGAMKELNGQSGEDLPPTATWDNVAQRVGTRTAIQCRQKWVMHLSWQEQGGHEQWTVSDDLKLIRNLTNQDAGDEEEVEWEEMCERWASARGPCYLRNKWTALKRDVPNYRIRTFQENLDYLVQYRVPAIEKQIQSMERDIISDSDSN